MLFASARSVDFAAEIEAALAGPFDWLRLYAYADRERAVPATWKAIQAVVAEPPPDAAPLQNVAMITEFRMFHLEQYLKRSLEHLHSLGIETLLLKGAALGLTHYDSFADRPMVDLDILVKPTDARRAWMAMQEQGWTWEGNESLEAVYDHTHHHLPPLIEPAGTGTALEVHTGLHPRSAPILMPAERVWERAETVQVGDVHARVPCLVDQVVHICTHFAWSHAMTSAGWRTFRDLDRLLRHDPLPEEEVVEEARRARATSSCYWTLRLARALVAAPVSDDLLDALRPPRTRSVGGMLERAYILSLLPDPDLACPSVTVQHAAWVLGMRPRWSGHGGMRPWDFSDLFVDPNVPQPSRWMQQWKHLPTWRRFLGKVLLPS
ncbi:MAG: nucleotidyltransferase family protein [Gemmatimonadota bacterium]